MDKHPKSTIEDGAACCDSRKPLAGSMTLMHAHINDTHERYLPVAVTPGNATAQTGDPGREEASFSRVGKVDGYAVLASALQQLRVWCACRHWVISVMSRLSSRLPRDGDIVNTGCQP